MRVLHEPNICDYVYLNFIFLIVKLSDRIAYCQTNGNRYINPQIHGHNQHHYDYIRHRVKKEPNRLKNPVST